MSTTGEVSETATDVKEAVTAQAEDLKRTAVAEAGAFADEVKTQATSVMRDARDQLEQQADAQARRLGSGMQDARRQLKSVADGTDSVMVSNVAAQLADTLGAVGDRIDDGGLGALADDVRSFARREPGLFLLGAGALGFLAARLLRHAGPGAMSSTQSSPSAGVRMGGGGPGAIGAAASGLGLPSAETGPAVELDTGGPS